MPRPKTKGDAISLRFPIAADTVLREKAAAQNLTPAALIVKRFLPSLTPDTDLQGTTGQEATK
jgi:hypothetical protein